MMKRVARRLVNPLLLGLVLGLIPITHVSADCVGVSPTASPLSSVTYLRSYQAFLRIPMRLAIDRDDNVFITDPENGRLLVRGPDGKVVRELRGLGHPVSVAVDSTGYIYIGDDTSGRVDVHKPSGSVERFLGVGDGEFQFPVDIAIHPLTGDVYVADSKAHVVRQYDPNGVLIRNIGGFGAGDGELNTPTGVFVDDARNELLVVDQRNSRIEVFDPNGTFQFCIATRSAADCAGGFSLIPCDKNRQFDQGLWVDTSGRIFVADAFEGRVHVVDRDGTVQRSIGEFGTRPGQMRIPSDLVIDSFGRLFVASANNARIDVFGLDSLEDPEVFVPGRLEVETDPFDGAIDTAIVAFLELPGYALSEVTGIVANGGATPLSISVGDADNDATPDLRLVFGADLIQSLPKKGEAIITVTGVVGSLRFEESGRILVVKGKQRK